MFIIGEATVDEDVAHARFACDLSQCHGACCTLPGGRGAPLADEELAELERAFPFVKEYLSERNLQVISKEGLYEGYSGNYVTTCIDERDCVFVIYEGRVAKCAIEKAYHEGKIAWRKPLSCHLFPIRISHFGSDRLRYERITECKPAVRRGEKENMPLYEFLREPLIRAYGKEWYDRFRQECTRRDARRIANPE